MFLCSNTFIPLLLIAGIALGLSSEVSSVQSLVAPGVEEGKPHTAQVCRKRGQGRGRRARGRRPGAAPFTSRTKGKKEKSQAFKDYTKHRAFGSVLNKLADTRI